MDTKFKKRQKRVRGKIRGTSDKPRLTVYRSNKEIYAQVIDDIKGKTLASYSSGKLGKTDRKKMSKKDIAAKVGEEIAKLAVKSKIKNVVFDRGAYRYHGRVKELAEGARKGGLSL